MNQVREISRVAEHAQRVGADGGFVRVSFPGRGDARHCVNRHAVVSEARFRQSQLWASRIGVRHHPRALAPLASVMRESAG